MILHIGKFASEYYSYKKELDDLVEAILSLRRKLRENKMFKYSDYIREVLNNVGIEVMDTKTGYSWKWTR
jgi:cysteinyl-tRNA synthetase